MNQQLFKEIINHLAQLVDGSEFTGHIFCVGGCCRDKLLGLDIKDIDMAVSLPDGGIKLANWLVEHGYTAGKAVVYPTYSTAMFRLKKYPDIEIECVQTRKEKYTDPESRNPVTAFGSLEEDCIRRDLTINSLYYNITTQEFIDLTGFGIKDIENHIIRTPADPDLTYDDDPLRILRCIRFATRYNWPIENNTFAAMIRNAGRLEIITKERIRDEFDKMLAGPYPVAAMELLRTTGAMHFVIPELEAAYDMGQNGYHDDTVWEHTLKVLENLNCDTLELRLAALLHDIGKTVTATVDPDKGRIHFYRHERESAKITATVMRRLKYSTAQIKEVTFLVENHMLTKQWGTEAEKLPPQKLRKFQYLCGSKKSFAQLLTLIDADNRAVRPEYASPKQTAAIMEKSAVLEAAGAALFNYKCPFSGREIMEIKGLEPGPAIKKCQEYLLKLAMVNPLTPREELLKHLKGYKLEDGLTDNH